MKKVLSLALSAILLLGMLLFPTAAFAEEAGPAPLPKVGEVISGFRVTETGEMDLVNAKTVLFEHEKTGAKLYYIQNRDIEKSFTIAFRTPAVDNTGVNHILEHVNLHGSGKYPINDIVFVLMNQTYSSFVNAMTAPTCTIYPVSSMSEDQLLKLADVYLDSVYNPMVYQEKNVFLREGWRYEMQDAGAPLTINGTVYNEMKGSMSNITTAAYFNTMKTLFPGSPQANNYGGDPGEIRDLTYEQLIETHKKYYHPSNSLMILYGDVDYTRFLKLINDEYLSRYDKQETNIDYGIIKPFSKKAEARYPFPVAASAVTKNGAQIDYAFVLNDITMEDIHGISIIAAVLNDDSSPLKKAFSEKKTGGSMYVQLSMNTVQPTLIFTAVSADESKAGEFSALVDECLRDIVKNGFDKELMDAMISRDLLDSSIITEGQHLGVGLSQSISLIWANRDDLSFYSDLIRNIKKLADKLDTGYYEDLARKYILDNDHAALVTTYPEAGLAEKQEEDLRKYLADLKASMSADEIEKTVNDTKAFNEWNSRESGEDVQDIIKDLQAVKAADLPVEAKERELEETKGPNGERVITVTADVGETGITGVMFDTSAVPAEKLHYLNLLSDLLGRLGTGKYTREQLSKLTMRHLESARFSVGTISSKDPDVFTPVLATSWLGLMGEYGDQVDLLKEIVLNTDFSDSDTVLSIIRENIANMKQSISAEPLQLLMSRSQALLSGSSKYANYVSGLEYYDFLVQLEQLMQEQPEAVIAELESVYRLVVNRTNMIVAFAGNESGIGVFKDKINTLINALPAEKIVPQDYSVLPGPAKREAISLDTAVQYNMLSSSHDRMGVEYNGKYIPIILMLQDTYLTPLLRYQNGVYTAMASYGSKVVMLISYRDPNIKETFDVFAGIPGFLRNAAITQDELDRYILSAFGSGTLPSGELNGAYNYIMDYLSGWSVEDTLRVLNEVKSVTVEDLDDAADMFEKLIETGIYSTAGSASKLKENEDLFESVIAFGQQTDADEAITTAQFIELVLQGIQEPVEAAKQHGLLVGDGKGNYMENEPLTKERLAVFIARIAAMNGIQLDGADVDIADYDSISPWARESVEALVGLGIMGLDENGSFNPKDTVTKSDVDSVLNALIMSLVAAQ